MDRIWPTITLTERLPVASSTNVAWAAAEATKVLEATGNLSVSVIVGQIRSTAADLLAATGMSHEGASGAIREAVREAEQSL